jgi:site-specific recombinase XerD
MADETRELIVINQDGSAVQTNTYTRNSALNLAILAWLDAKSNKSGSVKTSTIYQNYLAGFRSFLNEQGYDLDSDSQMASTLAQAWCGHSLRGKKVAPATFNQRRAVLSSFYAFAKKRGIVSSNPIELVDGLTTQEYRSARPLNKESVNNALFEIDRSTIAGARDYALLSILLTTGRRVNELVNLQVGDLSREGETLIITWRRTKGGKTMQDEMLPHIARVLIRYLEDFYGTPLASINPEKPVFVCLGNRDKGKPLTNVGISLVCKKHLGITKVHATRHTFAHLMEESGAKVSEIQAKLGHNNLQTTGRYLAALNSAKNEHAGKVASMLGIVDE